jgi:opacity protein-like surface antigen
MMKSKLLVAILLLTSFLVKSQELEFGVSLSACQYQGDLAQPVIQVQETKVNIGLLGRYTFNPTFALRGELNYGKIAGDDKYASIPPEAYGHNKRNLSFSSPIYEISTSLEYNILKYVPGSRHKRFTPFISAGIGFFHFDPTTVYNGTTYHLQQYKTELDKPAYKLNQVCFPIGAGIKWNVAQTWTLGLTYATRFTMTDYLDDVSHNWQTSMPGTIDQKLSYRGDEIGYPATTPQNYNDPNNPKTINRGNPKNRDTYLFVGFSITKTFRKFSCMGF